IHDAKCIYQDNKNVPLREDATPEEIKEMAVMRTNDSGTQYALTINHNFSGTWGTGYLENIGNPSPSVGKHWIDENADVLCQVDGIVQDVNNVNSRYIAIGYSAEGAPNSISNTGNADALIFNGVDNYLKTPSINISKPQTMTFEFWAKRDRTGSKEVIIKHNTLEIGFDENDQAYFHTTVGDLVTTTKTSTGWHYWKFVYERYTKIYHDTTGTAYNLYIHRDDDILISLNIEPYCETTEEEYTVIVPKQGCYLLNNNKLLVLGGNDESNNDEWWLCRKEWGYVDWNSQAYDYKVDALWKTHPIQICADYHVNGICDQCYVRGDWTFDVERCKTEWGNEGLLYVTDMHNEQFHFYNSFSAENMMSYRNVEENRIKNVYSCTSIPEYQQDYGLTFGANDHDSKDYFKGKIQAVILKVNQKIIGKWNLNDGGDSSIAIDSSEYERHAALYNFDTSNCWFYYQYLNKHYSYNAISTRQTVQEFKMVSPGEIVFDWSRQYAVTVNTSPKGFDDDLVSITIIDDESQIGSTGTGKFWFNANTNLVFRAKDSNCLKLSGYRDNSIDTETTIIADKKTVISLESTQDITWIYSPYMFEETVILGTPVMLSSVPPDFWKKLNTNDKPEYIAKEITEKNTFDWNDSEKKVYPLRGNDFFDLNYQLKDATCIGQSVTVRVTTDWPKTPHIIHIADTPPVLLDPSMDDEIVFISLKHVENDAQVIQNKFTATQPGRSVLHFKRNYIKDTLPTEISLSFNGKGFAETDPIIFPENFTIEFYARRNTRNDVSIAVGHGDQDISKGLSIGFDDNDHFIFNIVGDSMATSSVYTDTNWHHWACVYETIVESQTDSFTCELYNIKDQSNCRWGFDNCYTIGASGGYIVDDVNNNNMDNLKWDSNTLITRGCAASVSYNRKIYCDGELVKTGSLSFPYIGQGDLRIGANGSGWIDSGGKFKGELDEIRIWSVAKTQEEIASAYQKRLTGNESELMAYFRMDRIGSSYLDDHRIQPERPIIAVLNNMDPSNSWIVNTHKEFSIESHKIIDRGNSCVRVVETKLESENKINATSFVGHEIYGSGFHDKRVSHNGYVFYDNVPYNSSIYNREALTGSIYPVNIKNPANDGYNNILIVWYKVQDGISWPYQPVEYIPQWPVNSDRIVISSMLGSEGKNAEGEDQTYADADSYQQNYFDPKRYEDIQIYNQPNPELPGYNPNEEHAIVTRSYRNSVLSPRPLAAYALRNDLNTSVQNAFSFDGIDDYVDLGRENFKPTEMLTLELWLRCNWLSNNGVVIGNTEASGYEIIFEGNQLRLYICIETGYQLLEYDPSKITPGWHHIAATFDGQYIKFYIDGEEKVSKDTGGKHSIKYIETTKTLIGAEPNSVGDPTPGWYFKGTICQLRIWDIARTQAQIKKYMHSPLFSKNEVSLLAYYTFNQETGTTLIDSSGHNRHGILNHMDPDTDWISLDDLIQKTPDFLLSSKEYTSEPFVLVQLFDKIENKHIMIPYSVVREDHTCNYSFHYYMEAGDPVIPPFPLNEIIGATPPSEIFGFNKSETKNCYWKDHKGQAWAISGSGDAMTIENATLLSSDEQETRYLIHLNSQDLLISNDLYSIKVTDNRGIIGYAKFRVGVTEANKENSAIFIDGNAITNNRDSFTVHLRPGTNELDATNFKLFHYDEDLQLSSHYWYPLQPSFWFGDETPGDGTGSVGEALPWLPDGLIVAADGFPENMVNNYRAIEVTYNVVWPDNVPVLKAGESLTFPGGEFRADHSDYPGLPGVLAWATGQVVYDTLNPTMNCDKIFNNYLVRIVPALLEREVHLSIDTFPDDLKPASGRVNVIMNRWYFKELHTGLKSRIYYDPTTQMLGIRGFINDKTLGDDTLTAPPPSIYVLQPNILTVSEHETIKTIEGADSNFIAAVDMLYRLSRDPNEINNSIVKILDDKSDYSYAVGLKFCKETVQTMLDKYPKKKEYINDMFNAWLGTDIVNDANRIIPQISFGPGLAVVPNGGLLDPNNETFSNFSEGYITLAENNHPDMGSLPVSLHIIKVVKEKYRGSLKTVYSDNVFDEKITIRHSADFGADPNELVFQWWYREENGISEKTPDIVPDKWLIFPDPSGNNGQGMLEINLSGAGAVLLADNLFYARYRHVRSNPDDPNAWSNWAGAANSYPPDNYQAQLAEGWVKRVINSVNPFEARVNNFFNSDSPATYISMIRQAGPRYEGPVAFNPDKDVIENVGMIELYQTVLDRAKALSIDLEQPACPPGVVSAILLAASRISGFYSLLGNEAYNDALDPTIGFGTDSVEYGSLAPTIFTFMNQLPDLIDEEYALLCGRGENGARPVYNRLLWNFTKGTGEVAYAISYNINDVNLDGFIDEADGRTLYPQGHGDAWGHYLTAIKCYYDLLGHPHFNWISRSEKFSVEGVVIDVDYLDERKFAETAASKAKIGNEIVNITYRKEFVDNPDAQWQGYQDTVKERSWGVSEWSERTFLGSFFDWTVANAILPAQDNENTGIKKVDRSTVPEIQEISGQARNIQVQFDQVNNGLNPLGLSSDTVPFDINPYRMDPKNTKSATHFEQIYERAIEALENARAIYDYANSIKKNIRQVTVSEQAFTEEVMSQDRMYRNQLIEIFGTPYKGTIGAGKVYPPGYKGPDYYYYNYIDVNEVSNETVPPPSDKMIAFFKPNYVLIIKNLSIKEEDRSIPGIYQKYYGSDIEISSYTSTDFSNAVKVSFPLSTGKYSFQTPESWGMRQSPGEIQLSLTELIKAEADLQLALSKYSGLMTKINNMRLLILARLEFFEDEISARDLFYDRTVALTMSQNAAKAFIDFTNCLASFTVFMTNAAKEALPTSAGVSTDTTSAARSVTMGIGYKLANTLRLSTIPAKQAVYALELGEKLSKISMEIDLSTASFKYNIKQYLNEVNGLLGQEAPARLEIFQRREHMRQVSDKYRNILAKGLRLLEERKAYNAKIAQKIQGKRYMDMAFRKNLNQALSKYRNSFDLASRYVYLAAKAYDYETNLSEMDPLSAQPFLTQIIRQRHLGQYENGRYLIGQGGLGEILTALKINFDGLAGQMGFNNPQTETGRFSLRSEMFRLKQSEEDNTRWKTELQNHSVANLWSIPEFRKYCRPFTIESSDAQQPGIVIGFGTNILFGKNFFGWPLSGGDHAYDPTNYSTKIRSVGLWFEGYDNSQMAETPRVYLVPAGMDVMLVPNSSYLDTREWSIVDQQLPLPLPVQKNDFVNPDWIPSLDSLDGSMIKIKRFSSFRAYHDSGYFDENQMTYETRLIGRSVWNTRWMLIIPGGTFHYDPDQGINLFIESVTDIKLFFQTYAFSGN
ncbi:MAG: hypothetical protein HQK75_12440, partial [Candidatus Magnetomorum sp.]|nr:hypothetical protein [Candidatus Magnetomorum sp.]